MLLHLLDNGLNSLEVGLEFYDKYLFDENLSIDLNKYYGNLKFGVIGIQNCIELVIKKILSDINDLLIYDMETIENPDVLRYIGNQHIENEPIHLDYFFGSYNNEFITLPYKKCIERFATCCSCSNEDFNTLKQLGYYRNVLTHFGREDIFGQDKIVLTLNRSLEIFNNQLIPLINKNKEKINQIFCEDLQDFINRANIKLVEVWEACNEHLIQIVEDRILDFYKNDEILIEEFGDIQERISYLEDDELNYDGIKIVFKNGIELSLEIEHIPKLDLTVFVHDNEVFGFVDYELFQNNVNDVSVFIPKRKVDLEILKNYKKKVWKDNKSLYEKLELNPKAIINNYKKKILKDN